jgi:membrane complex biogenesis BtpA family protein
MATAQGFKDAFGSGKVCIGVVHLLALPGSPGFGGSLTPVVERAVEEARILAEAGYDGLIVENYGDLPFLRDSVGPETVASMAVALREVAGTVRIPVGVNVLRNDYRAALALAGVCGCRFVRINVLVGAFVTSEGLIQGDPGAVLRLRRGLAPDVMIFADVLVKHARPLPAADIGAEAVETAGRGCADCLIVTGPRTGSAPAEEDLRRVKAQLESNRLSLPVLVGSGVEPSNAIRMLELSDGIIVGSYIRQHGRAGERMDLGRASEIAGMAKRSEAEK